MNWSESNTESDQSDCFLSGEKGRACKRTNNNLLSTSLCEPTPPFYLHISIGCGDGMKTDTTYKC